MIITIILCAVLCAVFCLYVLKPLQTPRTFMRVATLCALTALGLYLVLGSPELPAHPTQASTQRQADMRLESGLIATLEKNPDDEDALVRLVALRIAQGRLDDETMRFLDRAEKLKPHDRRIALIRAMISKSQ